MALESEGIHTVIERTTAGEGRHGSIGTVVYLLSGIFFQLKYNDVMRPCFKLSRQTLVCFLTDGFYVKDVFKTNPEVAMIGRLQNMLVKKLPPCSRTIR